MLAFLSQSSFAMCALEECPSNSIDLSPNDPRFTSREEIESGFVDPLHPEQFFLIGVEIKVIVRVVIHFQYFDAISQSCFYLFYSLEVLWFRCERGGRQIRTH